METLIPVALLPLVAANNRLTEAFKLYLRDHTPVQDEPRRILTLVFSFVIGIASVFLAILAGVKFDSPILEPFAVNDFVFALVVGSMVSFGGAFAQPVLELVDALVNRTQPTIDLTGVAVVNNTNDPNKTVPIPDAIAEAATVQIEKKEL